MSSRLVGLMIALLVLLAACVVIIVAHPGSEVDYDIGGSLKVAPSVGISGNSAQAGSRRNE